MAAVVAVAVVGVSGGAGLVSRSEHHAGVSAAQIAAAAVPVADPSVSQGRKPPDEYADGELALLAEEFVHEIARMGRQPEYGSLQAAEVPNPGQSGQPLRMVWEQPLTPVGVQRLSYGRPGAQGDATGVAFDLPTAAAEQACALLQLPAGYATEQPDAHHDLWSCTQHHQSGELVAVVREARWHPAPAAVNAVGGGTVRTSAATVATRTGDSRRTGLWGPDARVPHEFADLPGTASHCDNRNAHQLPTTYPARSDDDYVQVPSLGCWPGRPLPPDHGWIPQLGITVDPPDDAAARWMSTGGIFRYGTPAGEENQDSSERPNGNGAEASTTGSAPVWRDVVVVDTRRCTLPAELRCGDGTHTTSLLATLW